jgi:hypothetical protein
MCTNQTSPLYLNCDTCSGVCGTCQLNPHYGDGSNALGNVYRDVVALGPGVKAPVFLGAMSQSAGKFSSFLDDGILGLAFPSIAGGVPTFMDQLVLSGVPNVFSACYGSYDGGEMVFGGYDPAHVLPGTPVTVPVDNSMGFYGVTISSIGMGANSYDTTVFGRAILDTGTTLIVTSDTSFVVQFRSWVQSALSSVGASAVAGGIVSNPGAFTCFTREQLSYFVPCMPPLVVSFNVNGVVQSVSIPASSYLWIRETSQYCPGQYAVAEGIQYVDLPPGIDYILGDVLLRNLHTTYDRSKLTATFRVPNSAVCGTPLANVSDTATCAKIPLWASIPLLYILLAAFGGAVVIAVVIIIICCCCCRRKKAVAQYQGGHGYTPVNEQHGSVNHAMAPYPGEK